MKEVFCSPVDVVRGLREVIRGLGSAILNNWSERRCADGFVESAVGHYFWYFSTLLVVLSTTVAKLA